MDTAFYSERVAENAFATSEPSLANERAKFRTAKNAWIALANRTEAARKIARWRNFSLDRDSFNMPLFKIYPSYETFLSIEVAANSPLEICRILLKLDCREADVVLDGCHPFSLRLGDNGAWAIFERDELRREQIKPFG